MHKQFLQLLYWMLSCIEQRRLQLRHPAGALDNSLFEIGDLPITIDNSVVEPAHLAISFSQRMVERADLRVPFRQRSPELDPPPLKWSALMYGF